MDPDLGGRISEDDPALGIDRGSSLEDEVRRLKRPTSWIGARSADLIVAYLGPSQPFKRRQARLFSLAVVAAVGLVFWLTRWPLAGWPNDDMALYLVHPVLWLAVALLAGFGWRRLEDRPPFSPMLASIALAAGLAHVAALIVMGAVGSFVDSPLIDTTFDFVLNAIHVLTLLAGTELARAYVFTAWKGKNRPASLTWVSLMFAVVALTAAELTPFDSIDEFLDVAGGRWVPVLAISVLATALAGVGGPAPSFAYRLALVGFMWLSPRLPDVHWIPLLVVGMAVPWIAWRVVIALYRLTEEGEEGLKGQPEPRMALLTGLAGVIVMLAVVAAGLFLVFGTGLVGFRTQIIEDDSMEPEYERGDLVLVQEDPGLSTLDVGDVVRVIDDGETQVRRITAVYESQNGFIFSVQGDNLNLPQRGITEEDLAGEVILRIPNGGDVILWWRD